MKTLTLIRGLPGSGKSTLAVKLEDAYTVGTEADAYFYDDYGNYVFDADKLKHAHEWCQNDARELLDADYNVLVSNTFTTLREMKEYYLLAKEFGAQLNVITCQGQFGSEHNVPEETMDKMRARFFHGDVIKELGKLYDL
jgi:predicted kinase